MVTRADERATRGDYTWNSPGGNLEKGGRVRDPPGGWLVTVLYYHRPAAVEHKGGRLAAVHLIRVRPATTIVVGAVIRGGKRFGGTR